MSSRTASASLQKTWGRANVPLIGEAQHDSEISGTRLTEVLLIVRSLPPLAGCQSVACAPMLVSNKVCFGPTAVKLDLG